MLCLDQLCTSKNIWWITKSQIWWGTVFRRTQQCHLFCWTIDQFGNHQPFSSLLLFMLGLFVLLIFFLSMFKVWFVFVMHRLTFCPPYDFKLFAHFALLLNDLKAIHSNEDGGDTIPFQTKKLVDRKPSFFWLWFPQSLLIQKDLLRWLFNIFLS